MSSSVPVSPTEARQSSASLLSPKKGHGAADSQRKRRGSVMPTSPPAGTTRRNSMMPKSASSNRHNSLDGTFPASGTPLQAIKEQPAISAATSQPSILRDRPDISINRSATAGGASAMAPLQRSVTEDLTKLSLTVVPCQPLLVRRVVYKAARAAMELERQHVQEALAPSDKSKMKWSFKRVVLFVQKALHTVRLQQKFIDSLHEMSQLRRIEREAREHKLAELAAMSDDIEGIMAEASPFNFDNEDPSLVINSGAVVSQLTQLSSQTHWMAGSDEVNKSIHRNIVGIMDSIKNYHRILGNLAQSSASSEMNLSFIGHSFAIGVDAMREIVLNFHESFSRIQNVLDKHEGDMDDGCAIDASPNSKMLRSEKRRRRGLDDPKKILAMLQDMQNGLTKIVTTEAEAALRRDSGDSCALQVLEAEEGKGDAQASKDGADGENSSTESFGEDAGPTASDGINALTREDGKTEEQFTASSAPVEAPPDANRIVVAADPGASATEVSHETDVAADPVASQNDDASSGFGSSLDDEHDCKLDDLSDMPQLGEGSNDAINGVSNASTTSELKSEAKDLLNVCTSSDIEAKHLPNACTCGRVFLGDDEAYCGTCGKKRSEIEAPPPRDEPSSAIVKGFGEIAEVAKMLGTAERDDGVLAKKVETQAGETRFNLPEVHDRLTHPSPQVLIQSEETRKTAIQSEETRKTASAASMRNKGSSSFDGLDEATEPVNVNAVQDLLASIGVKRRSGESTKQRQDRHRKNPALPRQCIPEETNFVEFDAKPKKMYLQSVLQGTQEDDIALLLRKRRERENMTWARVPDEYAWLDGPPTSAPEQRRFHLSDLAATKGTLTSSREEPPSHRFTSKSVVPRTPNTPQTPRSARSFQTAAFTSSCFVGGQIATESRTSGAGRPARMRLRSGAANFRQLDPGYSRSPRGISVHESHAFWLGK